MLAKKDELVRDAGCIAINYTLVFCTAECDNRMETRA